LGFFDSISEPTVLQGLISMLKYFWLVANTNSLNTAKRWIPKINETKDITEKFQTLELYVFRIRNNFK